MGRHTSIAAYLAAATGSRLPIRLDSWTFAGLDSPRDPQPPECCSNVARHSGAETARLRRTAVARGEQDRAAAAVGGGDCST
jgi:hypothetical protein